MLHKIVVLYDAKAEAFHKPVFAVSDAVALRSFSDACKESNTDFAKYPEDFSIFSLGEYNDATATFDIRQAPLELAKALAFVEKK